ncbi:MULTISPECIES: fimbrial protein [Photorhabdus]|uniref:Major fimbrial subunit n=2 Tax=Photorhabdus asymbiotica TaxID=291112 RepID=C7BNQ4_PHOAA|nr:fimbrial protein [Photorhabdus asymbiotica]RKS66963.1 major type 1 subunit fimbrin (pilin) [Photorhabdus asymbiotica]CAQ83066.1 major fimbrial subunit precursor [Photorhabdus asymbiotica]
MKKNFILASLVMILGTFSSFSALSYDGKIQFTGKIIENGCTVAAGAKGKEVEVNFGSLLKSTFGPDKNTVGVSKGFSISLTTCPRAEALGISFDGEPDANNKAVYSSGVTGVGIQIFREDGTTEIKPGEYATRVATVGAPNGNTDMQFIAKLISTNTNIATGNINKPINFTIIYP